MLNLKRGSAGFRKKTRAGEECRGLMRRLDDATARFVGGNLNWRVSMGLTVNRQMSQKLTVNRQKRNNFTVNRRMSEPKLAVKLLRYP